MVINDKNDRIGCVGMLLDVGGVGGTGQLFPFLFHAVVIRGVVLLSTLQLKLLEMAFLLNVVAYTQSDI